MMPPKTKAALFDMDGVIVVNMQFHEQAFVEFCKKYDKKLTREFFMTNMSGSTNEQIMPRIFGDISAETVQAYAEEKEALYRELYAPHLKPAKGFMQFLDYLKTNNVRMAVASNAPMTNVRFVADALGLDKYMEVYLNGTMVENPKPAPDMFLKAADILGADPANSVIFEDSVGGLKAAKAANMRSVALLTTHSAEEMAAANLLIHDFDSEKLYRFWETM
jgi:beta-phosphoglucomutase